MNNNTWPKLPTATHVTCLYSKHVVDYTSNSDEMQLYLNHFEKKCKEATKDYDNKLNNMKIKINACFNQIQSSMNCFSSAIQRQNKMIYVLKSSINECLNINKIRNQAICLVMTETGDQQYKKMIEQPSSIPFDEYQSTMNNMFSTYTPLIDDIMMKMMDVNQQLTLFNE